MRQNKRAHKNDFGHVLVVAGSPSMLGAACLVSLAALRGGAGLVTAAIPRGLNLALQQKISHAIMTFPVPGAAGDVFGPGDLKKIAKFWQRYTAVAIGPGLGLAPATVKFVRLMVEQCPMPMVVDADALNALAPLFKSSRSALFAGVKYPRVLTPHPGEFFRLSGLKPATDRERRTAARSFAIAHKAVLVLKGYRTVVASPDGKVFVNTTGNPGMATAGTGDVLTGMIAALMAQGQTPFKAACCGVHLHGKAGDSSLKNNSKFSLIATDLINAL